MFKGSICISYTSIYTLKGFLTAPPKVQEPTPNQSRQWKLDKVNQQAQKVLLFFNHTSAETTFYLDKLWWAEQRHLCLRETLSESSLLTRGPYDEGTTVPSASDDALSVPRTIRMILYYDGQ